MTDSENKPQQEPENPSPLQVIGSVAAAAFGVQTSKNRQRDFQQKSIVPFVIGGIVFTAAFVGVVYLVVSAVLRSSGAS